MEVSTQPLSRVTTLLLLAPLVAALTACGSSSDSSSTSKPPKINDTTAPTVSSTTPANDATGVDRSAEVSATFNEDMLAKSVVEGTFTLAAVNSAEGSVNFDPLDNVASFTPSQPLLPATTYTATLSADITDTSGNPLAGAPYAWSFTTADGAWSGAEVIENNPDPGFSRGPSIAVDSSGNALAAWARYDDKTDKHDIWGSRYSIDTGWSTPELIEETEGDTGSPLLAMDASGNALAIWAQATGNGYNYRIRANRYIPGTGWGTPELIQTVSDNRPERQHLTVNANGDALVVWEIEDNNDVYVYANSYTPSEGWNKDEAIAGPATVVESPRVALDANGNGLAMWKHSTGSGYKFYANHYNADTGWDTAAPLETDKVGDTITPDFTFDADGNALAIWAGYDGGNGSLYTSRFNPDTGWSTAKVLKTDAESFWAPQLAVDANGNAIAVWAQDDNNDYHYRVYASRYTADAGWGEAELIEAGNNADSEYPQVTIDASGNALAIWIQDDGPQDNLWANRYMVGSGWGSAELIETDNNGDVEDPHVSIGGNGNGIAVWSQYDGTTYRISANRFE